MIPRVRILLLSLFLLSGIGVLIWMNRQPPNEPAKQSGGGKKFSRSLQRVSRTPVDLENKIDVAGRLDEKSDQSLHDLSHYVRKTETPEAAISWLEAAVLKYPDDTVLATDLGLAYLDSNRLPEAQTLFQRQLGKNPRDPEALFGMGALAAAMGDNDKAEEYFQNNLAINPDHLDTKYNLADLYTFATHKKLDQAETHYQEVLRQVPENLDAQNGIAAIYLQSGRNKEAINLWNKLADEHTDNSILYSNLGEAYFRGGNYEEASRSTDRAISLDPENADAYYYKALAEKQRGNLDLYQHFYQEAMTRDPDLANLPP